MKCTLVHYVTYYPSGMQQYFLRGYPFPKAAPCVIQKLPPKRKPAYSRCDRIPANSAHILFTSCEQITNLTWIFSIAWEQFKTGYFCVFKQYSRVQCKCFMKACSHTGPWKLKFSPIPTKLLWLFTPQHPVIEVNSGQINHEQTRDHKYKRFQKAVSFGVHLSPCYQGYFCTVLIGDISLPMLFNYLIHSPMTQGENQFHLLQM